MKLPITSRFLYILLGLLAVVLLFVVWKTSNAELISILHNLAKPENSLEQAFFDQKIGNRISELKIGFTITLLGGGIALYFLSHKIAASIKSCLSLVGLFWERLSSLNKKDHYFLAFVIVLFVSFGLWLAIYLPIHYDEAYSYMYYIRKGPLVVSSLYNSTNNHILYNLIASFIHQFLGGEMIALRSINLIASLSSIAILYVYIRARMTFFQASFVILGLIFSLGFWFYSIQIRGYAFVILFSLIAFILTQKLIEIEDQKSKYALVIVSALGLYTMPTYILVFLSQLSLLIFFRCNWRIIWKVFFYTFGLLGLFMVPVLIVSGPSFVTSNPQIAWIHDRFSLLDYPRYVWGTLIFLFGLIPLIILFYTKLLKNIRSNVAENAFLLKNSTYFALLILVILITPFINFAYPPARIFVFALIPFVLLGVLSIQTKLLTYVFVGAIALTSFYNSKDLIEYEYLTNVRVLYSNLIIRNDRNVHFYHHPTMRVLIDYYDRNNRKLNIGFTPMGENIKTSHRLFEGNIFTPFEDQTLINQPIECSKYYCIYPLKINGNG